MDIQKAMDNLKKHGFTVSLFQTGKEAADYVCSQLSGRTIGMGGSQTALALELPRRLSENNRVYSHSLDGETAFAGAMTAEVYISSANAISETGEIVNIDGRGNRVAGTLFGPKKVIFIAGVNKLEPDLEKAIWRARNIAAPLNARRLNKKTPCAMGKELRCYDCSSPDRICRGFVVHTNPMSGTEETEVILINEELGY